MIKVTKAVDRFTSETAWDALDIATVEGASVRVHWTDKPYKWHTNDGAEVFMVLAGKVMMHYRQNDSEQIVALHPFDVFFANVGDAHVAHPEGEARILVVEKKGSV